MKEIRKHPMEIGKQQLVSLISTALTFPTKEFINRENKNNSWENKETIGKIEKLLSSLGTFNNDILDWNKIFMSKSEDSARYNIFYAHSIIPHLNLYYDTPYDFLIRLECGIEEYFSKTYKIDD